MVVALVLGAGLAWLARSGEGRAPSTAGTGAVPVPGARAVRGVTDQEILMGMSAAFSGPPRSWAPA